MKQIIKEINEIKRMKEALTRTSSSKLMNDYTKSIKRRINDIKEYCSYRNIDYEPILKEVI